MIHVCSLARLHDTVRDTGARHVVTLIKDISLVHRPASIAAENHLLLDMDDINEHIDGYVVPAEEHVGELLRFVQAWDRSAPLVVHCYGRSFAVYRELSPAQLNRCRLISAAGPKLPFHSCALFAASMRGVPSRWMPRQ